MRQHSTSSYNKLLKSLKAPKKNAYAVKLDSIEWKKKRSEIILRDRNECQLCMSTTRLQVHHKKYLPNREPHEYDNNYLITLCYLCHAKFHKKPTFKKTPKKKKDE